MIFYISFSNVYGGSIVSTSSEVGVSCASFRLRWAADLGFDGYSGGRKLFVV
jgi:hypothetical protein